MTQVKTQVTPSTVIDARGPRFSAAITTAVLATALATNNPVSYTHLTLPTNREV